jgi:two-component system, NtrC family, nitrogen regulation sensor histidine kinase NtrY
VRLALRLALTFGLLAAASSVLLGAAVRTRLAENETARFRRDVEAICQRVQGEVKRQARADHALVEGACKNGALVEKVGIAIDQDVLDDRRLQFVENVRDQRRAMGVDELLLAAEKGEVVGVAPMSLIAMPAAEVDALVRGDATQFVLRKGSVPAVITRCRTPSQGGKLVALVAARHLDPLLARLAETLGVSIVPSWPRPTFPAPDDESPGASPAPAPKPKPQGKGHGKGGASASAPAAPPPLASSPAPPPPGASERATCAIDDAAGNVLAFDVVKSKRELEQSLQAVDNAIGIAALVAAGVAFLVAIVLARSVSRPLADLAAEAGKVAAGEARPLEVKGSGEVRDLGAAFDRMIKDLAVTRRRLAAASRVAAWREVARRVAHEVKNPLAPIRAAVETLRRLRAREDPRFDEYFDEATRTVLDEVHRISNIVTEFTRFARLPQPRIGDVDVEDVARHVVQVHKAAAGDVVLAHQPQRRAPTIRADRDQVIQVLTNLVQNALDAVRGTPGAAVSVTTDTDGHYVSFSVADNGSGIAPEIASRLFEPYATNKPNGTGLGLAIAQRIAIEHNGELSYVGRSADGRGAVSRLLLPVEGPPPVSEMSPPSSDG